jgi:hypothetical protein
MELYELREALEQLRRRTISPPDRLSTKTWLAERRFVHE